jgi:hypothetical protein
LIASPTGGYSRFLATLSPPIAQSRAAEQTPELDPWYLVTTWSVPYTFHPSEELVALLYTTDAAGITHPLIGYQFGAHNLLNDRGGYVVDRVPLPLLTDDLTQLTLSLELWNPATQTHYPATSPALMPNSSGQITLGPWSEVSTASANR